MVNRGTLSPLDALAGAAFALALAVPGCINAADSVRDQAQSSGDTPDDEIPARIDEDGRIEVSELGIDGYWYAFADAYGDTPLCTAVGKHAPDHCSKVTRHTDATDASSGTLEVGWPKNHNNEMCVMGIIAQQQQCCNEKAHRDHEPGTFDCPEEDGVNSFNCEDKIGWDYTNMWGAGIGFDFRLEAKPGEERSGDLLTSGRRKVWNAHGQKYRVLGIRFRFAWNGIEAEPQRVRVEFPMMFDGRLRAGSRGMVRLDGTRLYPGETATELGFSTEEHINGSPFAQRADDRQEGGTWDYTPLSQGENEILFERDLRAPPADTDVYFELNEEMPVDQLLGVQFHAVPPDPDRVQGIEVQDRIYHFCVSELRFVVDKDPNPATNDGGQSTR